MTTTEATVQSIKKESADRENVRKEIMKALLAEEHIFIGEALKTANYGGFIIYEPKDHKYFKAKRIIRPYTPEEKELYEYYEKRWEEILEEQMRIDDELPDDASERKMAKAEKKIKELEKEEQETIDKQEEINSNRRIIIDKEEINEDDAMKFIDEVVDLTLEFRTKTVFQNKEEIISYLKKELKAGKRIPVEVPFEQQIVNSFDTEIKTFSDLFIKAKNYNPEFFKNYIYMDMNNRKLIFHVKNSLLPNFIKFIPETVEYDQDLIKYAKANNVIGDNITLEIIFNNTSEILRQNSSFEFDIPLSIESTQILLERIALLTLGDNEIDKWLDS